MILDKFDTSNFQFLCLAPRSSDNIDPRFTDCLCAPMCQRDKCTITPYMYQYSTLSQKYITLICNTCNDIVQFYNNTMHDISNYTVLSPNTHSNTVYFRNNTSPPPPPPLMCVHWW